MKRQQRRTWLAVSTGFDCAAVYASAASAASSTGVEEAQHSPSTGDTSRPTDATVGKGATELGCPFADGSSVLRRRHHSAHSLTHSSPHSSCPRMNRGLWRSTSAGHQLAGSSGSSCCPYSSEASRVRRRSSCWSLLCSCCEDTTATANDGTCFRRSFHLCYGCSILRSRYRHVHHCRSRSGLVSGDCSSGCPWVDRHRCAHPKGFSCFRRSAG